MLLDCEIPSCEEVKISFQTELLSSSRARSPLTAATGPSSNGSSSIEGLCGGGWGVKKEWFS